MVSSASSLESQKSKVRFENLCDCPQTRHVVFKKKKKSFLCPCFVSFCPKKGQILFGWKGSVWVPNPTRVTRETPFTAVVSGVDSCEQTAFSSSDSYSFSPQADLSWPKAKECTTIKQEGLAFTSLTPPWGVLRADWEKMITLSKALSLTETGLESLFTSDVVIEFHLTCHKHPVCRPRNKVNNLAGNCCVPSKQVVNQFCTKSGEPAV